MSNIIGIYQNHLLTSQTSPLFSASDDRFPSFLRGYWKKVEWCAYDLVWDILPDAFQAGWEHEHLLRNVGSLPWPGLAWPNEYGLVCKVQWGDRVKRITGEEITVSRMRLSSPGDQSRYEVSYRNPKRVVRSER